MQACEKTWECAKEDRCGVVICVAELAEEAGLAIPDFRAYKTSCLRGVPRGVSRNGIARSKGIETVLWESLPNPQHRMGLKSHAMQSKSAFADYGGSNKESNEYSACRGVRAPRMEYV